MSGGTLDVSPYSLESTREQIQEVIDHNYAQNGYNLKPETLEVFKKAISIIHQAEIYIRRIDYLLSSDDSEDSFHEYLKEDSLNIVR
jgi:wyosine [tRNA(Phe)-imidazoG37] synthetase (radical SAM superfamily)